MHEKDIDKHLPYVTVIIQHVHKTYNNVTQIKTARLWSQVLCHILLQLSEQYMQNNQISMKEWKRKKCRCHKTCLADLQNIQKSSGLGSIKKKTTKKENLHFKHTKQN